MSVVGETRPPLGSYISESAKWEAYQFSDPFATASFICGNRRLHTACRPNCDHYPKVTSKDDFEIFEDISQAVAQGYSICQHCDASKSETQLDLPLIKMTIDSINHSIGFTNESNDVKRRAFSVPSVGSQRNNYAGDRRLTRNESEHIKLVELACRHIASAAASSIYKQDDDSRDSKKKRRGGVLGFKELASKSKLSPWHFHRVFKSVTGLTPKSYGDQCWKFITERERPRLTERQRSHFKSNQEISKNFKSAKTTTRRKSQREDKGSPRSGAPPTQLSPLSSSQTLKSFSDITTEVPAYPSATGFNFDTSNKNTLDINITPFRHHSLDLGSMNLDFSDFNTNILSNLSPQYISLDQFAESFQNHQQQVQPQPVVQSLNQQQELPQYYLQQNQKITAQQGVPDVGNNDLTSQGTQIDESQWPALEALTPETAGSRLLSPPSTVSDSDFKASNSIPSTEISSSSEPFYEALKNSPLENVESSITDNCTFNAEPDTLFDILDMNDELVSHKHASEPNNEMIMISF